MMAGAVYLAGERVAKADRLVDEDAALEVRRSTDEYVGYGGVKLAAAVQGFRLDVRGRTAIDIGSSTGGFVDYLLRMGAARVYAVDVGTHQLHERLRTDPRVVVMENVNARYLSPEQFSEAAGIITVDVSFISLKKIIPAAVALLGVGGFLVTLVKPQFEVGRYQVGKGGIVKDADRIADVLDDIKAFGASVGIKAIGTAEAPRERERKNKEYFILWER